MRRRARLRAAPAAGGFTLLELLVAITLFALLSALLIGGFRFGGRVWEQAEATAAQVNDVESAYAVVRRLLGSALPVTGATPDGEVAVEFWGEADGVSFVAPSPAQAFTGGLQTIALVRMAGPAGQRLVLRVEPFVAGGETTPVSRRTARAAAGERTVVLIDGARAIEFFYFGGDDRNPEPRWHGRWAQQPQMPRLISVRVTFPAGDRRVWPDLMAAPVVSEMNY